MAQPAPIAPDDTGLFRVLDDEGRADPRLDPGLDRPLLMRMYREMKRLRVLEGRMVVLQRQGRVGFYGPCTGQEAVPIATGFAFDQGDWVFPALRESAVMLVRGFPLVRYLAQVFGNDLDVLKGRQMPSHMSGRQVNQVAWSSCIGPQIPQAVGAAWAAKIKRETTVTVGFLGDGASSQPDFHNAINFAARFKVPCVLVCQNNHWSISVPTARQTASKTIAIKGRAYGVPSYRVDGNDVLAMFAVLRQAAERARAGLGPSFVEAVTYRIGAHSTSDDPSRYRSQEEVDSWIKKDPLDRFERYLKELGAIDQAFVESLEGQINAEVSAAIDEVERASPPPRDSVFDDVYGELPWNLREQREQLRAAAPSQGHGPR
jgi:pyruvate dehydrogenase E1 component alpha subunit